MSDLPPDRLPGGTLSGPVRFPPEYGAPGGPESLRSWRDIEPRRRTAANYWVTTLGYLLIGLVIALPAIVKKLKGH